MRRQREHLGFQDLAIGDDHEVIGLELREVVNAERLRLQDRDAGGNRVLLDGARLDATTATGRAVGLCDDRDRRAVVRDERRERRDREAGSTGEDYPPVQR